MGITPLAGNRVDGLDVVRAHVIQLLVGNRHQLVLTDPGLERLEDRLIDAVHHRRGHVQKHDLVLRLDLARVQHRLLTVHHLDAALLQRKDHRQLGDVDAQRLARHTMLLHDLLDRPRKVV